MTKIEDQVEPMEKIEEKMDQPAMDQPAVYQTGRKLEKDEEETEPEKNLEDRVKLLDEKQKWVRNEKKKIMEGNF